MDSCKKSCHFSEGFGAIFMPNGYAKPNLQKN